VCACTSIPRRISAFLRIKSEMPGVIFQQTLYRHTSMRRLRKAVTKSSEYEQATGSTTSKVLAVKHWQEEHSPVAASGITTFAPASQSGLTVIEGLCASSFLKTRGVRMYFCTQMGANTASVTYGRGHSRPTPPPARPPASSLGMHCSCRVLLFERSNISGPTNS